ncbi:uncharacterized protein BJ212DRAFT_1296909, partial [Suillus subaureus]
MQEEISSSSLGCTYSLNPLHVKLNSRTFHLPQGVDSSSAEPNYLKDYSWVLQAIVLVCGWPAMYSGVGDPQYNFIDAQGSRLPGRHDQDLDADHAADYRYHYLHDQSEQEPLWQPAASITQRPICTQWLRYPPGDPSSSEGLLASSPVDTLPYPNILDAHASYRDSYATVTDTGNDSSMIFSNAPSLQLTPIDPHVGTMFPDPNIGARMSYYDNYSAGENPPAVRVESAP